MPDLVWMSAGDYYFTLLKSVAINNNFFLFMTLNLNFPKAVPFLPGHVFSDPYLAPLYTSYKENHHKT